MTSLAQAAPPPQQTPPPDLHFLSLTRGEKALVDAEDFDWLNQWKWSFSTTGYATRNTPRPHRGVIYMHRLIMNAPKELIIDHHNRNKLDNRRHNLRLCDQRGNQANRYTSTGSSQYKGVYWDKAKKMWSVFISISKGKRKHVGRYRTELEAALAYDKAAREHYGAFALPNFPSGAVS